MFATQFDNPNVDMEADAKRATAGVNEAGQEIWSSYAQSGVAYNGALEPDMSWYAVRDPAGMGAAARLSGEMALVDESFEAIAFDQLLLSDAA